VRVLATFHMAVPEFLCDLCARHGQPTPPSQLDRIEHMCYAGANNARRHRSRVVKLRHNVQSIAEVPSPGLSIRVRILSRKKPQNKYRYRTLLRCQGPRRIAAVAGAQLHWHAEAAGYLLFERFRCPLRWNCRDTATSRAPGPAVRSAMRKKSKKRDSPSPRECAGRTTSLPS
jgi:hypothetical protein